MDWSASPAAEKVEGASMADFYRLRPPKDYLCLRTLLERCRADNAKLVARSKNFNTSARKHSLALALTLQLDQIHALQTALAQMIAFGVNPTNFPATWDLLCELIEILGTTPAGVADAATAAAAIEKSCAALHDSIRAEDTHMVMDQGTGKLTHKEQDIRQDIAEIDTVINKIISLCPDSPSPAEAQLRTAVFLLQTEKNEDGEEVYPLGHKYQNRVVALFPLALPLVAMPDYVVSEGGMMLYDTRKYYVALRTAMLLIGACDKANENDPVPSFTRQQLGYKTNNGNSKWKPDGKNNPYLHIGQLFADVYYDIDSSPDLDVRVPAMFAGIFRAKEHLLVQMKQDKLHFGTLIPGPVAMDPDLTQAGQTKNIFIRTFSALDPRSDDDAARLQKSCGLTDEQMIHVRATLKSYEVDGKMPMMSFNYLLDNDTKETTLTIRSKAEGERMIVQMIEDLRVLYRAVFPHISPHVGSDQMDRLLALYLLTEPGAEAKTTGGDCGHIPMNGFADDPEDVIKYLQQYLPVFNEINISEFTAEELTEGREVLKSVNIKFYHENQQEIRDYNRKRDTDNARQELQLRAQLEQEWAATVARNYAKRDEDRRLSAELDKAKRETRQKAERDERAAISAQRKLLAQEDAQQQRVELKKLAQQSPQVKA